MSVFLEAADRIRMGLYWLSVLFQYFWYIAEDDFQQLITLLNI